MVALIDKWEVQVHGGPRKPNFEISVVNTSRMDEAQKQWGWFDENKLLISHNGGPCRWPVTEMVWNRLINVAHEVTNVLNGLSH